MSMDAEEAKTLLKLATQVLSLAKDLTRAESRISALEAEVRELKARIAIPPVDIVGISEKTALEMLQERFPEVVPCKE